MCCTMVSSFSSHFPSSPPTFSPHYPICFPGSQTSSAANSFPLHLVRSQKINSQSLEDTFRTFRKNTLWKNTLKNKYFFGNTLLEIQIVDENFLSTISEQ